MLRTYHMNFLTCSNYQGKYKKVKGGLKFLHAK